MSAVRYQNPLLRFTEEIEGLLLLPVQTEEYRDRSQCERILERILVAHELGHAVLHTKIAMMHGFQEMEVFDDRSIEENEANFFAAELLLEDGEVLECLSEHTFFETAKMLYVPAALLDYKFSLLHEKGELVNSMYIRKADFLKEDLHAYDNDISYGDI